KGGFSTVYSARWNNRKRLIALKSLYNSSDLNEKVINESEIVL
ncbi:11058_t:CDS:2, partial [Cetraspora pellucida]